VEKQPRKTDPGTSTRAGRARIGQGKYDGVFPCRRGKARAPGQAITARRAVGRARGYGKIVELSFEQDPVEGGTAWMAARTENLDGSQIRFVLERADEGGTWVEVGAPSRR